MVRKTESWSELKVCSSFRRASTLDPGPGPSGHCGEHSAAAMTDPSDLEEMIDG